MTTLEHLLAEIFDDSETMIDADTAFATAPGWDSLKHAELVVGIEQRFSLELTRDEIGRLTSRRAVEAVLAARGVATS